MNYRADDEQDGGEEEHVLVAVRQLHLEHGQYDDDEGQGIICLTSGKMNGGCITRIRPGIISNIVTTFVALIE